MACKARHKPVRTVDKAKPTSYVLGEEGITLVEYIGWFDLENYVGTITGAVYRLGLNRTRAYVDNRDLAGILEITEDEQKVFRLWQS